ncbi:MAG: hypothetical protein EOO88_56595, partial [Pedobacter sp.]
MTTADMVRTSTIGPLLGYALSEIDRTKGSQELSYVAARMSGEAVNSNEALLPIVIKLESKKPSKGEPWNHYKDRMYQHILPVARIVREVMGREPE